MLRTTALLVALASCFALTACGGGSGGGPGAAAQQNGSIQLLNNEPTHISRIDVGLAGSAAPKEDQLNGVLLPGAGYVMSLPAGVYDLDVYVFGNPFGVIRRYTNVAIGPGDLETIVVAP